MVLSQGTEAPGRRVLVSQDTVIEPGVVYRYEYRVKYIPVLPDVMERWLVERFVSLKDRAGIEVTYWKYDSGERRLIIEVVKHADPAVAGWVVTVAILGATITGVLLGTALVIDRVSKIVTPENVTDIVGQAGSVVRSLVFLVLAIGAYYVWSGIRE